MTSTSARPKGVPLPCGGFSLSATRCSYSDRPPGISVAASLRSRHRSLGLQVRFAAGQELLPPAGERCGGDPQLARERFDIFPAQKPEDCCGLALRRPPTPTVPPLFGSPGKLCWSQRRRSQTLRALRNSGQPPVAILHGQTEE